MITPDKTSGNLPALRYSEFLSLSDELLMVHLGQGHPDAMAVLFDRYHRLVLNVAFRVLRDTGEAEDLMQSVFLEIFHTAAQFDPARGTTKVWILQYAYHRSFNRREYLNLRGLYERPEESAAMRKAPRAVRGGALGVLESARLVQEALEQLTKVERTILEFAFYEGLTMREIAARTGDSFDSVRHHYYRGLEKVRSVLCDSPKARREPSSAGGIAHVQP
jgi:RNA polymerase sigma-70 factor (ECF subfamily)